jgi:hypothetical protein
LVSGVNRKSLHLHRRVHLDLLRYAGCVCTAAR